jgi:uncharacterized repeat protein (TIGR01451 family)
LCPNVHITKAADAGTVTAPSPIGFTITVTNGGPGTAFNVTVTDPLPNNPGLAWTIDGGTGQAQCSISGGALTCNFGSMAPDTTQTVHISSPTANTSCGGTVTNTATVTASNGGSASATTTVALLCAAKGKVTGGGQVVPASGGRASFGYIAQRKTDGGPATGHFNYVNLDTRLHINGPVTDLVILSPTSARFSGTWGANCTFTVYMEDNGEPGVQNGDRLEVSYSCPASGPSTDAPLQILLHGNNQMHKAGANSPPVANADAAATAEKAAVNLNALANDIPGPVEDAGQALTVTAVGAPASGTAFLNGDGGITYVPAGYFNGTDSFTYTICDNGTTDGVADPLCATGTVNVNVTPVNDAPVVGTINAPVDAVKVSTATSPTSVGVSASFTDPDVSDTHTASWNWGDGTTSAGTINETNKSATGSHAYTAAGLYTVQLTLTDNHGGPGQNMFRYVVVYDPAAGYIASGAGSVTSPAGSYTANLSLAGTSTISQLAAKYQADGTLNSATNTFRWSYSPAGLIFTSSKMSWLVVSGNKVWLRGEGTTNMGVACYYLVSVADSTTSTAGPDKVRIRLVRKDTGAVIYDNQMGAPDDALAATNASSYASIIMAK